MPKNTGTTAQSLVAAALALAGGAAAGAGAGATERVVERDAPSVSAPGPIASLLAPTLGGIGGGAGEPTGGDDTEGAGCGDAEGADGAGGEPTAGSAGATDRFKAKVLRLGSAPVGAGGGAAFGDGAMGRAVGAGPTGRAASLAKLGRL